MKRKAASSKSAMKRSRTDNRVSSVVNALADADAVPQNLRNLLKGALPIVLEAPKVERHAYETEVVEQAQQALAAVQKDLEQKHTEATAKQNEVISPNERQARTAAKNTAAETLQGLQQKVEANKSSKKDCEKNLVEAEKALAAAKKDQAAATKDLSKIVAKKESLSNVLEKEYASLLGGTSGSAEGKKAVKKLVDLGKQFDVDSTLLATFPITCKKKVADRTEFETNMFSSLKASIDNSIAALAQQQAEAEPVVQGKDAATNGAQEGLAAAKAALKAAEDELKATENAKKQATKDLSQADHHLRKLWEDMRKVCEAQDSCKAAVDKFQSETVATFNELKEREPEPEEPEEPEPVAEEPEPAVEEAAPAAEEAPVEATSEMQE